MRVGVPTCTCFMDAVCGCVSACVRVCVYTYIHMRVGFCVCECVRVCVRVCVSVCVRSSSDILRRTKPYYCRVISILYSVHLNTAPGEKILSS